METYYTEGKDFGFQTCLAKELSLLECHILIYYFY